MELTHPTADGIGRPTRTIPRGVRLLALILLLSAGIGGFGAPAGLAADVTVSLSVSPASVPLGGLVTMTATVTSPLGTPNGTVSFNSVAPSSLYASAQYTLNPTTDPGTTTFTLETTSVPGGTYSMYAQYSPGPLTSITLGIPPGSSAGQPLVVGSPSPPARQTQVALTGPSQVDSTQPVTLQAVVSEVPAGGTPTGTVSFVDTISGSEIPVGPATVPLDNGVAQVTVLSMDVGAHKIIASYNGGGGDAPSSSDPLFVTSSAPLDPKVSTNTTVVVSPSPIAAGDTTTIVATIVQVTALGLRPATGGRVTFDATAENGYAVNIGSAVLGTAPPGLAAAPNQAIIQNSTLPPNTYTITASYFGDIFAHDSTAAPVQLSVLPPRIVPTITYTGVTTVAFDHLATVAAVVTGPTGAPLAGRSVTFTIGLQSCTATTDTYGRASCPIVVTRDPGDTRVIITVTRDLQTESETTDRAFVVTQAPTTISATIRPGPTPSTTTLVATLLSDGVPVANLPVTLALDSTACATAAVTNGFGIATCDVPLPPGQTTGLLTAGFGGNADYAPSAGYRNTVTLQIPTTTTVGTGPILSGTTVTLSGTLFAGTTPLSGKTLHLSVGSLPPCDGVTNDAGLATCTVPGTTPLGQATTKAVFDGIGLYLPSGDTSSAALLYSFAKGTSTFVVGDKSATGAVTFWGAKWSKLNRVSGGAAPDSFKGFALVAPATCGATWTTGPGNSPDPPAGTLPQYMAVLVTSSVTKAGSSISGTTTSIVIVKTEPGYKNDPGHAGTGTVVATVCGPPST
jgi:hypothetical protein